MPYIIPQIVFLSIVYPYNKKDPRKVSEAVRLVVYCPGYFQGWLFSFVGGGG